MLSCSYLLFAFFVYASFVSRAQSLVQGQEDLPPPINLDVSLSEEKVSAGSSQKFLKKIALRDVERGRRSVMRFKEGGQTAPSDSALFTGRAGGSSLNIENDVVTYLAKVTIGSNNQTFKLIVDTGSSNTWIGADQKFGLSNTTELTGSKFSVGYGSGAAQGAQIIETVNFGTKISLRQSIGVATQTQGFSDEEDGILGLGPTSLTRGTLSTPSTEIPTVMETLFKENKIPSQVLGISFAPSSANKSLNGRMTLGGVDSTLFKGPLTWVPRTLTRPAAFYWGVNTTMFCGRLVVSQNSAGIMDTGTTLILLSDAALKNYIDAIPGAILDSDPLTGTDLVMIAADQVATIPPFTIDFGNFKATLSAEQQLFPETISRQFGGKAGQRYSVISSLGPIQGLGGLDFIIGQKFLEHFYTAYDGTNNAVGLAPSTASGFSQGAL
ncbi:aspartic peptidase A1 [Phakopsora pachyrhizi]|uniref:Aspartic peptidase A1 n=1 Tax=Phakopsora pachyrhizi TaxID=170000 RepID=A0AAV0BFI5_PHAPC|nr:aspartic peptidase A1 [Phakopsora pachyrhizi]CAH7685169.1 aspartic peptidase A1 [Phakopsora pachyrhizi]